MYERGRDQGEGHQDAVPESVVGLGEDHQLSCSSNDGDVGEGRVIQGLGYSASDFAPAFVVPQPPSQHSCVFGLLDGTREPQCCERIKDIATQ